jgi:recA bacterial DNA recombination protein
MGSTTSGGLHATQLVFSLGPMTPSAWVRQGTITEIVGELSSGRTSLMMACLRDVTARAGAAALVDADGAFDPASAARAGVALSRLLWVRCGGCRGAALAATDLLARCPGFALVVLDAGETPPRVSLGTAFRLRQAARRAGVAVLLVGRRRVAGAGATLAVRTSRDALAWAGSRRAPTRLAGMSTRVQVLRSQGAARASSGLAETQDERQWWTA